MTPEEWKREERRLKSAETRARNIAKKGNVCLADKLVLIEKRKAISRKLERHRQNYFELTQLP